MEAVREDRVGIGFRQIDYELIAGSTNLQFPALVALARRDRISFERGQRGIAWRDDIDGEVASASSATIGDRQFRNIDLKHGLNAEAQRAQRDAEEKTS